MKFGAHRAEARAEGPVEFCPRAEKHRPQRHAEHPFGMRLGIGQREGRAPRAPDDQPAVDAQMFTYPLHVGKQMPGRVGLPTVPRRAAPRAALIEEDRPEVARIEQRALRRLAAAARPAVKEHGWHPVRAAYRLDIELVPVAHRQHFDRRRGVGVVERELGIHHGDSGSKVPPAKLR